MATAIIVVNADGELGRCDAKCHRSPPGTRCRCVCGGALHGVGELVAIARADTVAERWRGRADVEVHPMSAQALLFDPNELT